MPTWTKATTPSAKCKTTSRSKSTTEYPSVNSKPGSSMEKKIRISFGIRLSPSPSNPMPTLSLSSPFLMRIWLLMMSAGRDSSNLTNVLHLTTELPRTTKSDLSMAPLMKSQDFFTSPPNSYDWSIDSLSCPCYISHWNTHQKIKTSTLITYHSLYQYHYHN